MVKFDKDEWIKDALRCGAYRVLLDGTIQKFKGGRYVSVVPRVHKKTGRVYFTMTFKGITKSVLVNRMVAWAYHPNPENKPHVNHLDGNKRNNHPKNLEWATQSENEEHAFKTGLKITRGSSNSNAKLTARQVEEIRAAIPHDLSALAIKYSVSERTIRDIIAGKTWSHV